MITKIQVAGYKSIKHLDLELRPINILLGSNGVGKSNLISVFSLLRNIYNQNLQEYVLKKGGANSLLHFGSKETEKINIELEFGDETNKPYNRYSVELEHSQDTLFLAYTKTAFLPIMHWHEQIHETSKKESNFNNISSRQAYYVNQWLRQFDVYHFHDTSDNSPMKAKSNVDDNFKLNRDGSNIASFLYFLAKLHPKHFLRIEKTIEKIAPFFDGFDLKPSNLNPQLIQLEWKEKGHPDAYFNAYHLSDGTLRFICLATLLMQPNPPATIVIDEPELGLHPVAINQLAALIRKVSAQSQVIISTQSTNLIDNFSAEDIIVTDRTKDGSSFKRLKNEDLENWLKEYTLGDLWGKNIIGAQPY